MRFEQTTLDNGMEILAEVNDDAVSTAVGFFVRAGSRDETPEVSGVSHFLEHMAFKGTETRTADDINRLFDDMGAKYNAYTSEENTVYHASILPEYLDPCIDLLVDLLQPALREDDFETERDVIIEEIGMYADSPMWSAYDRVTSNYFSGHPLGNSILGSKESVGALRQEAMRDYYRRRYCPSNIVVAASGKMDFDRFVDQVAQRCGHWKGSCPKRVITVPGSPGPSENVVRSRFSLESIYLMGAAPAASSALRFAAELLAIVIGDDTGSRFYWSMVDSGKVESVDLNYHEYEGAGTFLVGGSCEPALAEENLETIRAILSDVTDNGVSGVELQLAKSKVMSRLVLAAERPRNRLGSVAYNWIHRGEYRPVESDLADVMGVTVEDVRRLLSEYPLKDLTTVFLGPLESVAGLELACS